MDVFKFICLVLILVSSCTGSVNTQTITASDKSISLDFVSDYSYEMNNYYFQDTTIAGEQWKKKNIQNYDSISVFISYYPSNYIHSDSAFNLVNEFITSTTPLSENYELLTTRYEWIEGFPGIQFRVKNKSDGSIINKRSYLVENRLLEIQYSTKKWFVDKDDDIFDSINLALASNEKDYNLPKSLKCSNNFQFDYDSNRELYVPTRYGLSLVDIKMKDISSITDTKMEMVSISSYQDLKIDSLENYYSESIGGMVNAINGKLIKVEEKDILGLKGRIVKIYSEQIGLTGKYYLWLDGDCNYTIGALSSDKNKVDELFTLLVSKIGLE